MSYGSLSEAQAQVVRRHVRGRRVHDLGAGNLWLSDHLVRLGAREVVAVDMHVDFVGEPSKGVTFVCSSFRRFKDPVSVALVSWPAQYGTQGLEKILAHATKVIYLGVNDEHTVCGSKDFFEAVRKREVLHLVECHNNDLIVYGPRRVRREPLAHEARAEARYNWIEGGEETALSYGKRVLRRLLESAAAEQDADYEIERRRAAHELRRSAR